MRAVTLLLALLLISLSLAGCNGGAPTATSTQANNGGTSGGGSGGGGGGGTNPPGVPIADHVFLVVLENHSFSQNDAHDCPAGMSVCTDADKLAAAVIPNPWSDGYPTPLAARGVGPSIIV